MRPLAVLHVHLGARDGCAERQTAALIAGLGRHGHRALGLVLHGGGAERRSLDAGAPVFPLGPRFPSGPRGLLTWWSRERARHLAARGAWELIHYHDPLAAAAVSPILSGTGGAAAASRTIVTYRGRGARSSPRELPALRRLHRAGAMIVAASEALWSALVRQGFDEERLSYIHPG
ncbi:MAG TPA: glycosyltransferase family 4 protein, partial [Verrucomicrobiae bacterium]|nr:glycosyltransferase family 4 protein [Verrucomicrobiae bacterium]